MYLDFDNPIHLIAIIKWIIYKQQRSILLRANKIPTIILLKILPFLLFTIKNNNNYFLLLKIIKYIIIILLKIKLFVIIIVKGRM